MKKLRTILETKVYHGSKNKIKQFDTSYLHGGHDQKGPGLYTTTDADEAHNYGENHHTIHLDTTKFIKPTDKPKRKIIHDLVMKSPHLHDVASNYDENPKVGIKKLIDSCHNTDSMHESMERVWYDAYKGNNKLFLDSASHHYHGTIVKPNKFRPSVSHYVVWHKDAIKKITHE
jgi:hypothetical protein